MNIFLSINWNISLSRTGDYLLVIDQAKPLTTRQCKNIHADFISLIQSKGEQNPVELDKVGILKKERESSTHSKRGKRTRRWKGWGRKQGELEMVILVNGTLSIFLLFMTREGAGVDQCSPYYSMCDHCHPLLFFSPSLSSHFSLLYVCVSPCNIVHTLFLFPPSVLIMCQWWKWSKLGTAKKLKLWLSRPICLFTPISLRHWHAMELWRFQLRWMCMHIQNFLKKYEYI